VPPLRRRQNVTSFREGQPCSTSFELPREECERVRTFAHLPFRREIRPPCGSRATHCSHGARASGNNRVRSHSRISASLA
jgi:hypothetical protein